MDFVVAQITGTFIRFVTTFADIALNGPATAILLVFGAIFVTASSGVFGYLVAGAVLDIVSDAFSGLGRSPPPEAK